MRDYAEMGPADRRSAAAEDLARAGGRNAPTKDGVPTKLAPLRPDHLARWSRSMLERTRRALGGDREPANFPPVRLVP